MIVSIIMSSLIILHIIISVVCFSISKETHYVKKMTKLTLSIFTSLLYSPVIIGSLINIYSLFYLGPIMNYTLIALSTLIFICFQILLYHLFDDRSKNIDV